MEPGIIPINQEATEAAVFDTANPMNVIGKATNVSNELAKIIQEKRLYKQIGEKKHVLVEGWTTMLAMLGIFPHVEYCRRLDRENEIAYEARILLKTMRGQIIGSGEAICSSKERNWMNRDEYAIKSMAQTRATGKAGRVGFSWIMALAGYDTTPAEEMPHDESIRKITEPQRKRFYAIAKNSGASDDEIKAFLRVKIGSEHTRDIPIDKYEDMCKAFAPGE